MMRNSLWAAVLLFVGCGPAPGPSGRVSQVGWAQLVNAYRDTPAEASRLYSDKPIQVYLPSGAYRVSERTIETYCVIPENACALRFDCRRTLKINQSPLIVSGVCRGSVFDGVERANGIRFYVLVERCEVMELNPSR